MKSYLDEDREFFLEVIDELVPEAASDESVAQATPEEKARWGR